MQQQASLLSSIPTPHIFILLVIKTASAETPFRCKSNFTMDYSEDSERPSEASDDEEEPPVGAEDYTV
jgi:hypothetical protein